MSLCELHLAGEQVAALAASSFILSNWSFEQPSASALVAGEQTERAHLVSRDISSQWIGQLEVLGLWRTTGLWTRDLIAKRARVQVTLRLPRDSLRILVVALRAARQEFANNWSEFCTAAPGALDWYEVGPEDLETLAADLELRARASRPG